VRPTGSRETFQKRGEHWVRPPTPRRAVRVGCCGVCVQRPAPAAAAHGAAGTARHSTAQHAPCSPIARQPEAGGWMGRGVGEVPREARAVGRALILLTHCGPSHHLAPSGSGALPSLGGRRLEPVPGRQSPMGQDAAGQSGGQISCTLSYQRAAPEKLFEHTQISVQRFNRDMSELLTTQIY